MKTVYYAHCQAIYDTPQEERDFDTLRRVGLEVVTPNTGETKTEIERRKSAGQDKGEYMDIFRDMVRSCDVLAFRSLPDGRITAGTAKEIAWAAEFDIPVIELPSAPIARSNMTVEETREYLAESGQR